MKVKIHKTNTPKKGQGEVLAANSTSFPHDLNNFPINLEYVNLK